jgi:hypothetical protein
VCVAVAVTVTVTVTVCEPAGLLLPPRPCAPHPVPRSPLPSPLGQAFKTKMSADCVSVMGSGWGWLVYNAPKDALEIRTTANQDLVSTDASIVPLLGIDVSCGSRGFARHARAARRA